MSAYRILSVAHKDIVEIWEYIARENLVAADRVIDEIYAVFDQVTLMPRGGFKRTDWTDQPLRFWLVSKYLIAYFPDTTPVQIIGVLHGARDIPKLLTQRLT